MDPASQRVVEEVVESHAPPSVESGGRGESAPPEAEAAAQPQFALFQQMTEFYWQMMRAILPPQPQPQPPPAPHKSHLEKLRKHGSVDFFGKREDDPMAIEN